MNILIYYFLQESDDEELNKWNAEDECKQLEVLMDAQVKDEPVPVPRNIEKNECSNDLFPGPSERTSSTAVSHINDNLEGEEALRCWDDSSSNVSSILPAGQGDPTGRRSNNDGRLTPFTKLLKSGLLDSASRLSATNDHPRFNEVSVHIVWMLCCLLF